MLCSAVAVKEESALVLLARSGDDNALHVLFVRYEPFIREYSGLAGCAGVESDDLMQEGRLGLVSAIKSFRDDAGASFKTFAFLCIKRQILSAVRRAVNGKNVPMNGYISLDDVSANDVSKSQFLCANTLNPEDTVILRERISAVKSALDVMFTPFERKLFLLYLNGFSYNAIAKTLHVGSKKVDNSLQRIKRRLSLLFD